MNDTLINLIRQRPFKPFEIQMSNGEVFHVTHPETAALGKSNVIISRPDSDEFDICSLLHIANVTANGSAVSGA
jgi:hypothetical protein